MDSNKHLKPLGPFLRVNTLELTVFTAVARFKNRHNTAATVHDVVSLMDDPPAYTTVKTVLDRLTDKGFLCRGKSPVHSGAWSSAAKYYTSAVTLRDVLAQMQAAIDEIVGNVLEEIMEG